MIRLMPYHLISELLLTLQFAYPIGETACADFASGCVPLTRQHLK